ncbi:cell division protein FtsL [Marinobacterium iners]|uniref:cell division protein FtsL n=1 Tax=Marinobacterium iners TaxID=48076 RepID=UPI001A8EC590|nr:cell division protein FtsL [Marinobacterium iners]QSR34628.1 cell division protein FtsL [Marinobacterium iners]
MRFGFGTPAWLTAEFWRGRLESVQRRFMPRQAKGESEQRIVSGGELLVPALLVTGLTLAVMISAMAVIFSAYEYRRLFNQHQILVHQWDELQVEWGQYLLEQSVWSSHHRIESLAASEMDMVVPETEAIEIVRHEQK